MNSSVIGCLLLIFSLCLGLVLACFLVGYYFPQLTPKKVLELVWGWPEDCHKSLKVILEKQPMENLLAKNWRTLLLIVGVLLAIFVWPTLYRPLPKQGSILMRENRISGEIQKCRPDGYGEWY
jgi:hypothetical protein